MSSQAWTPIHQSQVTTTNAKKLFWNRPSSSLLRRLLQYWPYWILLFFLLLLLKSLGATQLLYFAAEAVTLVVDFMLLLFAFQFYGSSLRQKLLGSSWVDENNTVAALYAVCSSVKYFWYFFISATTFPLDFPKKRLGTWTDHIYSIRPF